MKAQFLVALILFARGALGAAPAATPLRLSREDYVDRVNAIWHGQIVAVSLTLPFEHKTAAVEPVRVFPKRYTQGWVDDDWYYEMCAVRGFEKYGIGMTADQLGQQWLENNCGSYGSSAVALQNLRRGIKGSEAGHPRYNRVWWTIGPVFSADLYGALAPGMPNVAARMAREFGHLNGYAEAVDGAVLFAGAISLGFVERDVRAVLRQAVQLVHPSSPYRLCVESAIALAEAGHSFDEVVNHVEDRWHIEYPATNNAVPNGGIAAAALWFGEGDFWKTVDLACRAADFTDTDNSAASAVSVLAAMHGMKALPAELVAQLDDRIVGTEMNRVKFTPPVDEKISVLARRTAAIGEKIVLAHAGQAVGHDLLVAVQTPETQPAERFVLADLMRYWNLEWRLERAGFGGDGAGAMRGVRGITYLDGEVLATYPRDEIRGLVLRRTVRLGQAPRLSFEVAADPGKAWELNVYVGNRQIHQRIVSGAKATREFAQLDFDLSEQAGREVSLRLYQRVLMPGTTHLPGNAYWRRLEIK
ncbi:MAG: ADP-ribosylglycohydrolase family protein [Verrucomicrobia bacterium]|nr:ADP-ribosylglycohydrolase family protein [Verrucomicrobiota bacterium]